MAIWETLIWSPLTTKAKTIAHSPLILHTAVGKTAIAAGIEAGYDIFSQVKKMRDNGKKLYVFGRYEYYDSYHKAAKGFSKYEWTKKQRMAVGLNYYPMKDIVVKAEYSKRFLKSQYNNEPSFSLGIAYAGFFH